MSYAIFRVEPINKLKDLGQIGAHNTRTKEAYKSNPDIDISRTKNNIDIVPLSEKYSQGFYELVKDGDAETRSFANDVVKTLPSEEETEKLISDLRNYILSIK